MAGFSNYLREKLLEHFFNAASTYTSPVAIYLGLDSVLATAAGAGTEISAAGYTRQAITFGAYASRRIASDAGCTFTPAATWPTVVGGRLWDAPTGGNQLAQGRIQPNVSLTSGQPYTLAPGEVVVSLPSTFPIGTYLAQRMLEKAFKGSAHATLAGSVFAHLVTVRPDNDGAGGTYLVASGYAAQAATFAAYAAGRCYLGADITFDAAANVAYGDVPGWVLRDNVLSGSGNFLCHGANVPLPNVALGAPVILTAANTYIGMLDGAA
jgi:hypothetical protein